MADARPGLYASVKGLLGTSLTLLQIRLQLLGTELEEERRRVLILLLWGGVALIALGAGVIFAVIFLIVLFWDSHRLLALGIATAGFLGTGVAALFAAYNLGRTPSGLFSASLAELSADREALRAQDANEADPEAKTS